MPQAERQRYYPPALVGQPGLVDAAVIYASVSSLAADNWKQFYRPSDDRLRTNRQIARTYGLPDDSPEFWRAALPRPYFNRITEPVLVHHGTRDDTCPIRWSDATVKALKAAGKDVTFLKYRGEGHTFDRQWQRSIERTVSFFDKHMDELIQQPLGLDGKVVTTNTLERLSKGYL